jgi:YHS domain-containing protein/plastocyanin
MRLVRTTLYLVAVVGGVLLGPPLYAHDVKDPVCRMTVDSDTTRYKHKLGNKSFYFCSKQCQVTFARTPAKYEKMAAQLEKEDAHEYRVDLKTPRPAVVGQPVPLEFAIRYADSGKLVRKFEVIHEKLFHLLMVSEDMSWFEHQHPVRGADGIFRISWRFPRAGRYRLYADFTPADGDNQVLMVPLTVAGANARTYPLKPDLARVKQVGDYRVSLTLRPGALQQEKQAVLTYTVRDRSGRLLRNMQPFIGAPGHLIAISQDGKEVIHTHALSPSTRQAMAHGAVAVTPAMATEKGPNFSFKLTLPTDGLYKTWAQFMHNNRVITVPFTFHVAGLWADSTRAAAPAKPARAATAQRARVAIDLGYKPDVVTAKAGRPVQITFVRQEKGGCGEVVQFPGLGIKRTLKAGEKTVVSFTPKKAGTIKFTCGMDMYQGRVVVR